MKRKKIIFVLGSIILLLILQTLPVFMLKPFGSKTISNEFINLYYQENDEKGADEVFNLLNEKSEEIYEQLQYERKSPIDVYIYKSQKQLAIREAGFITLTFAPSWHIGDSHNGTILMVSPYTKVKGHTHDSILTATLHELVHAINYRVNDDLSYFWDNGLATYLANQIPEENEYKDRPIPSIDDMHTNNGLEFGNMGGYAFSYKYIEYLDQLYGWNKVVEFAKGNGGYEDVFNKSEEEIYKDWCQYLKTELKSSDAQYVSVEDIFNNEIEEVIDSGKATGATATLVVNGEVVLQKGYGYSDKTTNSVVDAGLSGFRIGSVSKTMVALAALVAMEEGVLDLNTDILQYLEEDFPKFKFPITMHHLLTHTAGFEDIVTGIAVKNLSDTEPLAVSVRKYKPDQIFKPNETASYSNYGIALAAYVIEKATGTDFAEYSSEKIFTPLEMNSTTFNYTHDKAIVSKAYLSTGEETFEPYMNLYPEGSVVSTAEDMSRYIKWLLSDQESILKNESKAKLFKRQYFMADELNGIGYIWNRKSRNGIEYYEKKGETVNFYSRIILYPQKKSGLFISFNTYVPEEDINAITSKVTDQLLGKKEDHVVRPNATIDIEGSYVNAWSSFKTAEKFFRFILPGKMIEIKGSISKGYEFNNEKITLIGENLYETPIGKIKFLERDGKTFLATDFSQTYVQTSALENKKVSIFITVLFFISSLTFSTWSMISLIRKNKIPKIVAALIFIQLLGAVMLFTILIIGMFNYSVLSYVGIINTAAWIILSTTLINIMYSIAKGLKDNKILIMKYMYIHNIVCVVFCIFILNMNLL